MEPLRTFFAEGDSSRITRVRVECPLARLRWWMTPEQYAAYRKDEREHHFRKLFVGMGQELV